MSEKNNGGNAFPSNPNWIAPGTVAEAKRIAGGMTLRDYFAAKALPAMVAPSNFMRCLTVGAVRDECNRVAERAYQIADAMIRARDA